MARPRLVWIISALALTASTSFAATMPTRDKSVGDVWTPGVKPVSITNESRQLELTRGAAWREFKTRYGAWSVVWNEATGTPHRALGPSIRLPGFANDAASADRAVRTFIAANPAMFGDAPELQTAASIKAGRVWYVRYRQTLNNTPILFTDWEFRVFENGRLMAFGADARRPDHAVRADAPLVSAVAREAAKTGLNYVPGSSDRVEGGDDVALLPYTVNGVTTYRTVYSPRVITRKPLGDWRTLVDARTGEVLWRKNHLLHAITGKVNGDVHLGLPSQSTTLQDFPSAHVTVGAVLTTTDASGNYSVTPPGNVTVQANIKGPYASVLRYDGNRANFTRNNTANGTVVNIQWGSGNSASAERDAFYWTTKAHAYVKSIDPTFTGLDYQMPVNVNIDDECNAYWYLDSLDFVLSGTTCPNTANMGDIVYHEYDHALNEKLFLAAGGGTFVNEALQEGLADAFSALTFDDRIVGNGFFGVGTYLRDVQNTRKWPEDATVSSHETGAILAGALWDLRLSAGVSVARTLSHFALYGTPDDVNDGVAFSEYFVEVLIADDNNGDLSDGTPHFSQIVNAFNAHGIGTNYFLSITHTALDDQPSSGPYPITAVIDYTGPTGQLDGASPTLFYAINSGNFTSLPMNPTGNPSEYSANIPQQNGAIVRYYIRAGDTNGGLRTLPSGAPSRAVTSFIAGPASSLVSWNMEANPSWTIGAAGDGAAPEGVWVRVDPVGTQAQPEDDHTSGGTVCWVTGNGAPGDFPGFNDVDGGKTTLTTATFSAIGGNTNTPIISFYRWFSNNTGDAPGEDPWQVDISNNGGSNWVSVENTTQSDASWRRVLFLIQDYVTPTNNMKVRFVVADNNDPSLVEGAVDDFAVLAFPPTVGVDPRTVEALSFAKPSPNPFRIATLLKFTLPVAGPVDLRVFDVNGREVRSLISGDLPAGVHSPAWDGRDSRGRVVASGPYFVRLSAAGKRLIEAVVRIR